MSGLLKKRSREEEEEEEEDQEVLHNSAKHFHGRNEQRNPRPSENIEFDEKTQSEEQLVIASLVEGETGGPLFSGHDMTVRCENKESECGIDLSYLLEASDDELGLPASPVVQIDGQDVSAAISSDEEGFRTCCVDYADDTEQNKVLENWHFEDDFVDSAQFVVCDGAAGSAWDVVNLEALIDGDYSGASWDLETIC